MHQNVFGRLHRAVCNAKLAVRGGVKIIVSRSFKIIIEYLLRSWCSVPSRNCFFDDVMRWSIGKACHAINPTAFIVFQNLDIGTFAEWARFNHQ